MAGMTTTLIAADNVSKSYADKPLIDQVSFGIEEGERIGLIGVNGAGKSTLLKLVAGQEEADRGAIIRGGGVRVHYSPQEPVFGVSETALSHVLQGDAAALEHEAKNILTRLGITDFSAPVDILSGGQRKRVALARALIHPCELLVLDEPTNHIDNETVQWLETMLQKRRGALLMVTHDRYFLERVVTGIFELEQGRIYRYPGAYQAYLEGKLERETRQLASEDKRHNFLRNEMEWIKRGPRARGTKQKARTERFYEVLDQTPSALAGSQDWSTAASRLGQTVIELNDIHKGYADRQLIDRFSHLMNRRERIGVVGPNGSGKSTLLKIIAGRDQPDSGTVVIGATVIIGYLAQEHETLPDHMRVLEAVRDIASSVMTADGEPLTAAQMLERFLFPSSMHWTPVSQLSGGEKRRLAILRMLMTAPNVLLLDECTNDLDIPTLTVLEAYLDDFPGAVVVVSHDRYFLDRVVDDIFAFVGEGQITRYTGNFSDYFAKRQAELQSALPKPALLTGQPTEGANRKIRTTIKFTYQEQKDFETIDERIAVVEQALQTSTAQLAKAGDDYDLVQRLYAEQQALDAQLMELLERWTYLTERADEIERSRLANPPAK